MPNPSMGAAARSIVAIEFSSMPPLAKMVTLPSAAEILECLGLIVVHLDVRMRHGPEDGDAEELVRQYRGSTGKARDVACARGQQAGLGAVRTAQAEIDETLARRGKHHAGGLGGDHGLELQEIDQPRFDELA